MKQVRVAPKKLPVIKRRAWIWKRLNDFGEIRLGDIEDEFAVTKDTALSDMKKFEKLYPGFLQVRKDSGAGRASVYEFTEEWRDAA